MKFVQFLAGLVRPKSKAEDSRRAEFILNVLLLGSIALSAVANVIVLVDVVRFGPGYLGYPPQLLVLVLLFFLGLYIFSRDGFIRGPAYTLIGLYFAFATYTAYTSGADIPLGLLTYVLVITMSGILISTRAAMVATVLSFAALAIISTLQMRGIATPNLYWRSELLNTGDVIAIFAVLGAVLLVSWLSNREIEKSLERARRSEAHLREERDLLEVRVQERTRELETARLEKTLQLYRLADFGRLAAGLFHDLVNPLTTVLLNLERLHRESQQTDSASVAGIKLLIERTMEGAKRMERFVHAARRQMRQETDRQVFSL